MYIRVIKLAEKTQAEVLFKETYIYNAYKLLYVVLTFFISVDGVLLLLSHVLVTVDGVWIGDGASCTYGQYMHTVA
jgi:hypothetical protein